MMLLGFGSGFAGCGFAGFWGMNKYGFWVLCFPWVPAPVSGYGAGPAGMTWGERLR